MSKGNVDLVKLKELNDKWRHHRDMLRCTCNIQSARPHGCPTCQQLDKIAAEITAVQLGGVTEDEYWASNFKAKPLSK